MTDNTGNRPCVEADNVQFRINDDQLEIISTDAKFKSDGGQTSLSVKLCADHTRQLISLLSNSLSNEFDVRQAFRIPLRESLGVTSKLIDGKNEFNVEAKTISVTGAYVDLPTGPRPSFGVDDSVTIQIQFEDHRVNLAATVRRTTESGIGIAFDDAFKHEEIDPPEDLVQLVIAIQRHWIKSNVV